MLLKLLKEWKDGLQLTNALYQLYKSQRERLDGIESIIMEHIEREPLTDKDWEVLRKKVENK